MAKLTAVQIYALAKKAGFNNAESLTAATVALAESGGDPEVTHRNSNGSTDYGLMQINSVHTDLLKNADWKNPQTNMNMAYTIYKGAGSKWSPWSTYKSGANKKYTAQVQSDVDKQDKHDDAWWKTLLLTVPGAGMVVNPIDRATGGAVGDALNGAAETVVDAVDPTDGAFGQIQTFFETLNSAQFWKLAGLYVGGALLVILSLIVMLYSQKSKIVGGVVGDVVKTVGKGK